MVIFIIFVLMCQVQIGACSLADDKLGHQKGEGFSAGEWEGWGEAGWRRQGQLQAAVNGVGGVRLSSKLQISPIQTLAVVRKNK